MTLKKSQSSGPEADTLILGLVGELGGGPACTIGRNAMGKTILLGNYTLFFYQ